MGDSIVLLDKQLLTAETEINYELYVFIRNNPDTNQISMMNSTFEGHIKGIASTEVCTNGTTAISFMLSPTLGTLYAGGTSKNVTVTGINYGNVTCSSNNNSIATCEANGNDIEITPVGVGTGRITVREGNGNKTVTHTVKVEATTLTLAATGKYYLGGGAKTITATKSSNAGTLSITSGCNASIAACTLNSNTGVITITPVAEGSTSITIKEANGNKAKTHAITVIGPTVAWQKGYGGSESDYFNDVTATSDGGFVAVGSTDDTINGLTSYGSGDAIIVKYNSSGTVVWQKSYGGSNNDYFTNVTATSDGGFVTVGHTNSSISGLTSYGSEYVIIAKYNSSGTVVWQKSYGGSNNDYFTNVTATSDGGFVTVGHTNSSISGLTSYGSEDAMIVKYNSSGDIAWQKSYGGSSYDYFNGVTITSDGGYVVVGYTKSTISGLTSYGGYDAIIVKYANP